MNTQKDIANLVTISATDMQRRFGSIVREMYKNKQAVIVERDGLPVVVMLTISDYEALVQKCEVSTEPNR